MPPAQDPFAEVVRAALDVHRGLGPGLPPAIYQRALEIELAIRGLRSQRGIAVDLTYKGRRVGRTWVPLFAGGLIIAIRVVPALTAGNMAPVSAQVRSLGSTGIVLNFGAEHLELRRVRVSSAPARLGHLPVCAERPAKVPSAEPPLPTRQA